MINDEPGENQKKLKVYVNELASEMDIGDKLSWPKPPATRRNNVIRLITRGGLEGNAMNEYADGAGTVEGII